ncbi:hypothetical protein B0H14DRAFT_2630719 [Mycena olivaceomarginata]|nr:hypothetical protein B0H14DRAFT_2630719 [Mycena olivaceomarginata]
MEWDTVVGCVIFRDLLAHRIAPPPPPLPKPTTNLAENSFANVIVPTPPLPPGSLVPPLPPQSKRTTKTKKGSGPAKAHPTHMISRNLCLAVYAVDVGGTTAEFTLHWKALTEEKPLSVLLKAYNTYSKSSKGNNDLPLMKSRNTFKRYSSRYPMEGARCTGGGHRAQQEWIGMDIRNLQLY